MKIKWFWWLRLIVVIAFWIIWQLASDLSALPTIVIGVLLIFATWNGMTELRASYQKFGEKRKGDDDTEDRTRNGSGTSGSS